MVPEDKATPVVELVETPASVVELVETLDLDRLDQRVGSISG